LLSERGEASGAAVARELHAVLRGLDPEERLGFYRFLAAGFLPDERRLRAAAEAYLAQPSAERATLLAEAAEPARQELLRRMNMSMGGTAALVAMRKELLGRVRQEPALKPLDSDLRHLFASWFNRGFLELRRIDWETPASVLEKLIEYEAVHEVQGWDDLRRRLAADRRCFAFFHPSLPGEPLIFVEVALVEGLATAVQPLLLRDRDEKAQRERAVRADTAIFYSISNCQEGLRGVSFGNFLIKQVVEELKAELPHLTRFSTLSPVPSFRRWLEQRAASDVDDLLRADESAALRRAAGAADSDDAGGVLLSLLKRETWWENSEAVEALRRPLVRLCALHLTSPAGAGRATDPVARFHLGNGARLERINWLGNIAPRGIKESFGFMVNYLYDPDAIEANHEAFARNGTVMRSPAIDALLGAAPAAVAAGRSRSRLH
ncbi:MAG TPA: malonyl-CoA decarboxylase, partial [Stellaceae bacterium]|nr:malonyl-CoA decarboxylase [Stellaceae bacterium]